MWAGVSDLLLRNIKKAVIVGNETESKMALGLPPYSIEGFLSQGKLSAMSYTAL